MKFPYLVSILVPVYGAEKYIQSCADSIFHQTYENLEIIFVDDFTPDTSITIVEKVLKHYPNRQKQVVIVHHDRNRGLAAARNSAIHIASGEFIYHLDADDWIEPNTIEMMVKKQVETQADIVSAKFVINDHETDPHYIEPDYPSKDAMIIDLLTQLWHHEVAGRLIRRSLYTEHGIECIEGCNMAEDWHVSPMLVWYARELAFIDAQYYHYRRNLDSMCYSKKSAEKIIKNQTEAYRNVSSLYAFFKDKSPKYAQLVQKLSAPMCYQILMGAIACSDYPLFLTFRHEMYTYPAKLRNKQLDRLHRIMLRLPLCFQLEKLRHRLATTLKKKK